MYITITDRIMWREDQPIYRQLKERIVHQILTGAFAAGEALPSVRALSVEYQINHITAAKAYQELVDEGVVEKRRGLGMYVTDGASQRLLASERKKFMAEELPQLKHRLRQLNISAAELIKELNK